MNKTIWPEAETLRVGEGSIGVLLCHGFTGSVASVAPWAHAVAERCDARVVAPRLSGHGTSWQDLSTTVWTDWYADVDEARQELAATCDTIFVGGLSMGGSLALKLAEDNSMAGVLLVNPAVTSRNRLLPLTGVLRHIIASQPGIASDIKKEGVEELAYDRISVAAAWSMTKLWSEVRSNLSRLDAPVMTFRSDVDHVVDDSSHEALIRAIPTMEVVPLHDSYHVATLDNDAELIFERSAQFIREHAQR